MKKILLYSLTLLALAACKKKEPCPLPAEETEGIQLTVKVDALFGAELVDWTKQYINTSADTLQFDKVKFLLSNITLEHMNGSFHTLNDVYVFLDMKAGRDSFVLNRIPKGAYKSIRFQVGLDSAVNHGNPSVWATDHPLSPALNDMHWNWSGGYIFNVLEGYYKNQGVNSAFSYHVALDKNSRVHALSENFDLQKNSRMWIALHLDRYFNNAVTFSIKSDGAFSHSGAVDPVMDKLMQNMNGLFELKSVQ